MKAALTILTLLVSIQQVCAIDCDAITVPDQPKVTILPLSNAELDQLSNERVCIKSFFYPLHVNFEDVSTAEMGRIREALYTRLEKGREPGDAYRYYTQYMTSSIREGVSKRQVLAYADFLYALKLISDNRIEETEKFTATQIKKGSLTPAPTTVYTHADEATYFSHDFLVKGLILVNFTARAFEGGKDEAADLRLLKEYLKVRASMAPQIQMLGDPLPYLFANLGCYRSEF